MKHFLILVLAALTAIASSTLLPPSAPAATAQDLACTIQRIDGSHVDLSCEGWPVAATATPVPPPPTATPLPPTATPVPPGGIRNCEVSSTDLPASSAEQAVLSYVNQRRASVGAPTLQWSDTLSRMAVWMARDSAARGAMPADHRDRLGRDLRQRASDCGYPSWLQVHEALASGYQLYNQPGYVYSSWSFDSGNFQAMRSPGYSHAGIAYAYNPNSPSIHYWVMVLGVQ